MKKLIYVLLAIILVAGLSVLGGYCGREIADNPLNYWRYPRLFTIIDGVWGGFCLALALIICIRYPVMFAVIYVIGPLLFFFGVIVIDDTFVHALGRP
ncbi:MAG: hypothetical protein PHO56_00490 [Patescibacteria group bacterium]|nr:hypothetical protein [Patescibacteria group bacterium]